MVCLVTDIHFNKSHLIGGQLFYITAAARTNNNKITSPDKGLCNGPANAAISARNYN